MKEILNALLQKNMLLALLMGFSAGIPLLLISRTLQAWMYEAQVDLSVIGFFALVSLPATLKFVWAPLTDRYQLTGFGRRKSWMLLSQICLMASLLLLALTDPKNQTTLLAAICLVVAFFSATQDIVIDAYRRESLKDEELGLGSTLYIYGYRVAMLLSGAFALFLADHISWPMVYILMASLMLVGLVTTLWAEEPQCVDKPPPKSLKDSVLLPFVDFLKRNKALLILAFMLFYKLGDAMAGAMATPFYLEMGFTKTDIAAIAKTLGFFSTLAGAFIGGALIVKIGIYRCLWVFGVLQAMSTFTYSALDFVGAYKWLLAVVIAFEDISSGMGTAAFLAYIAALCNKQYTATQFALLTALTSVPRTFLAAPTGVMAKDMGWTPFFIFCALIALPGLLLLWTLRKEPISGS